MCLDCQELRHDKRALAGPSGAALEVEKAPAAGRARSWAPPAGTDGRALLLPSRNGHQGPRRAYFPQKKVANTKEIWIPRFFRKSCSSCPIGVQFSKVNHFEIHFSYWLWNGTEYK